MHAANLILGMNFCFHGTAPYGRSCDWQWLKRQPDRIVNTLQIRAGFPTKSRAGDCTSEG
jgi:hypothetical protein